MKCLRSHISGGTFFVTVVTTDHRPFPLGRQRGRALGLPCATCDSFILLTWGLVERVLTWPRPSFGTCECENTKTIGAAKLTALTT